MFTPAAATASACAKAVPARAGPEVVPTGCKTAASLSQFQKNKEGTRPSTSAGFADKPAGGRIVLFPAFGVLRRDPNESVRPALLQIAAIRLNPARAQFNRPLNLIVLWLHQMSELHRN